MLLLATTALTSPLLIVTAQAQNLPTGGSVTAGSVAIAQPSANQLNITQSSQSAVVNWQSFSVGQGSSVNIAQPNSSAALLNRVTGNTPSTISGSVTANGQVYLVNPNGIAITSSGTVNTGGFVASTLGISDSDFMAGKRTFTGNGASAPVSNAGTINVGRGGYAALIGGTVSNSGSINVPLGKAGLGSGEQATLDFAGDGFLQVAMPTAAGGKGPLIRNSGSITANGGSVIISAATARDAARNAVNISGVVQARSIGGHSGAIVIGGGAGGRVKISGRIDASSRHGSGGRIVVTGRDIKLRGATVDASGKTGGGSIAIGGGIRGTGPLQRAETTSIDSSTVIKADAITSGNGGNVVVWSDQLTTFSGTITAQGGALGGDGGFVETSGKERLSVGDTAFVNTLAPMGATGNWLLDPRNITIASAGAAALSEGSFGSGNGATDITIATGTINAAASNVTLQANDDITISNAISMTNSVMLTLNAGRSILVNANVISKGGFTATINDAGATSANRSAGRAAFTMAAGTSISTVPTTAVAAGAISITTGTLAADSTGATSVAANVGDITLAALNSSGFAGATTSAGGNITVTTSQGNILSAASGTVTITANGATPSGGTSIAGGAGGTVQLTATNGAIGSSVTSLGAISSTGGAGRATNANGGNGGAVTLTSGTSIWDSAITTTGGLKAGTGTNGTTGAIQNLATNGSITMTTDTLSAGAMTFTANTGSGVVTIQSLTPSTTMGIANAGSTLNLTAANLGLMTAKTLQFGTSANTGGIIIGTVALPGTVGNVVATSGSLDPGNLGAVTVNGSVTGANGNLTLNATASDVYLQSGTMTIGTLTTNAATNVASASTFIYNNATSGIVTLNASGVDSSSGKDSIGLGGAITANTLKLSGPGQIYQQTGAFKVTNLLVQGGTFIDLSQSSSNTFGTIAANTTGRLKLSSSTSFGIGSVGGVDGVTAGIFNVAFSGSAKTLTQTQAIKATEFSLTGTSAVATLTTPANQIGKFAASVASTGTISLSGTNGLNISALSDSQGNQIAAGVTAGTLTLSNTGSVTQSGRISATNLELLGTGGNYILNNTANVIGTLSANTGSINVARNNAAALTVGTVATTIGITTTGAVTLSGANTTTGITVNGVINSAGDVRLLSAGSIAVNQNITATGGKGIWLIPDTGASGSLSRAVTFTGGAKAITSGAGASSIYFNSTSYSAPSQNYSANVTGSLNPYMYVTTLQNLQDMQTNLTGSYALNKDIDASASAAMNGGAGFAPVGGGSGASFQGRLDGMGHAISGLTINRPGENFVGLFGDAFNATISNVHLVGGSITGGVAVGALVGSQFSGTISNSSSSATVTGISEVGGLVGFADGTIKNSYATGNVSGGDSVGGIAGFADGTITQSYATGTVTGTTKVGGLVGEFDSGWGLISSSYWDTQTSGRANAFGSGSSAGATGLTSAQFTTASNFAGWTFGTTAGGPGWVTVNANSTLNNAGGAAGATRPMLLSEASTNGTIASAHQLQLMALNLGGTYTLGGAIDMSETARASGVWLNAGFVPIGYAATDGSGTVPTSGTFAVTSANPFSGSFDGKGFAISNLTINRPTTDYVGLFGYAYNPAGNQIIKNVNLVGGSITGRDHVGSILGGNRGYLDDGSTNVTIYLNDTTTAASSSSATVTGRDFVGGLYGSVESSYSYFNTGTGTVSGRDYVGGVIGRLSASSGFNTDIRSTATVSGRNNVGGMGGYFASGLYGANYATGNVTATGNNVGGFVGDNEGTFTTGAGTYYYATGAVSGVNNVGGLVGFNGGTVAQSFATGAVTGVMNVGGLVGNNDGLAPTSLGAIDQSFATGVVRGTTNVGGLVGLNTDLVGYLSNSGTYATGAVYGTTNVGGLVGSNSGTLARISSSYSIGYVSGTTNVGGLVGDSTVSGSGFIKSSYFNTQTSGQSNALGNGTTGSGGIATSSMPKTTANLQAALQTGFSTTPWAISAGASFAYFKWLYGSTPQVVSGIAYSDRGTSPLAGTAAGLSSNGLFGTAAVFAAAAVGSTGANGYYYFLLTNNTLNAASPKQVLTWTAGASGGATFQQNATASLTGLSIYGTYLKEQGSAPNSSALTTSLNVATGGNIAAQARITSLANLEINPTGNFAILGSINTNTLVLSGPGAFTQAPNITAANLLLLGSGNFTLTNPGNSVGTVAANTGAISLTNSGLLSVGSVAGTVGVTSTGAVTLVSSAGDVSIASSAKVTAGSDANVVLSAAGNFINNRGNDAIGVSGSGRWLVYSNAPDTDTFGPNAAAYLDSGQTAVWNATLGTRAPGTVPSGNRYVFAYRPTLTFASTNAAKTYGDNAAATVSSSFAVTGLQAGVSGAFAGDTASAVYSGAPTFTSTGSAASATVGSGSYAITGSSGTLTLLAGYNLAITGGRLTVNRAALTVTATNQNKTYGETANLGTTGFTTSGMVTANGDAVSGVTLASAGAAGSAGVNGGTPYSLDARAATGSGLSNYTISYVSGGLTVNPAALTITASNQTKTYGNTANLGTTGFTMAGLVTANGDGVSGVTLASAGAAGSAGVNGGTPYALDASAATGSGLSNYTISYVSGGLTVNPAALTITASNQTKTYGNTANLGTTGFTTAGLVTANGDTVTGVTLASLGAASSAGVNGGTPYSLDVSAATGNGLSNYTISYISGGLTVNPAALTVTATNQTKTYGDTANLGTTGFTTAGLVTANGDSVTGVTLASAGAASTAGVNGGTPYSLDAGAATGNGLSNYTISYVSGGLTVNPAALTVTAANQTKTYGDTATLGTTGFTTAGLVTANGDSVTGVTLASAGAAGSAGVNGGTPYSLDASAATGNGLSNYTVSYVSGGLTVNPAALTVTAANQTKIYGDTANLGTTGFTTAGLVNANGDAVTGVTLASLGAAGSAGVNGGTPYSLDASAATGNGLSNYTISYVAGGLTVNPAALTVTAANQNKTYGDTANLGTTGFTTAGLVTANGDTVTGVTLASLGAAGTAGVNGGTPYSLDASAATGNGLSNYTVSYVSGGLTVNPAALTVTATNQTKTYGDTANLGTTGFTTAGLVTANGDAVTGVTLASLGAAGSAGVNGGTPYSLDASAATGNGLSNYTISYVAGGLTVNPAALTVTATNQNKTYGDTANLGTTGFTTVGLVTANGDTVTGVTLASAGAAGSAGVNGGMPYSLDASAATGSGLSNYTISYVSGGLTMNPAALTVTAANLNKTYGDTANLGTTGFTTAGLVTANGDAVTGVTLASVGAAGSAGVNGGTPYSLDASAATGNGLSNYTVSYVSGGLTVNPAALTVTATNQNKTYGDTANLGTTGFTTAGLVTANGDTVTGVTLASLGAASTAGVNGGTPYSLDASAATGNGLSNYTVSYVSGGLTVNPAALTVTASNQTKAYGDTANLGTTGFTTAGLVTANGDTVTGVALSSLGAAGSASVNGGTPYSLDASAATGNGLSNYTISYISGGLTVNPAALTVTATNTSKTYGQSLTFTGTEFGTSGLRNGETVGSVTLASAGAAGIANVAGSPYAITASGATGGSFNAANYTIAYVNGALTVTPANITVMADSQTRAAGTANPALTYQLSGNLYNGDSLTGALATNATTASPAGTYSITQGSLAASSNYNLTYQGAQLTVAPATNQGGAGGGGGGTPPSNPATPVRVAGDSFYPVILPDNARPVFGAATLTTDQGTGVFYADPRFDTVFVCFTGAPGTAQSCYAAANIKG